MAKRRGPVDDDFLDRIFKSDAVRAFTDSLASFSATLSSTVQLFQNFGANLSSFVSSIGSALSSPSTTTDPAATAKEQQVSAQQALTTAILTLTNTIEELTGAALTWNPATMSADPQKAAPEASGGGASGFLAAGAGAALFAIAIKDMIDVVGTAVKETKAWVQALSPATIALFEYNVMQLNATLGVAFVPLFDQLGRVAVLIAGELYPVMQALEPIVNSLSESIGGVLVGIVRTISGVFENFAPILRYAVDIITVLGWYIQLLVSWYVNLIAAVTEITLALTGFGGQFQELFDQLKPVFEAIVQLLQGTLTTLVQSLTVFLRTFFARGTDGMSGLVDVIKDVVKGLVLFAAVLGKSLLGAEFIPRLIANLERQGAPAPLAAQNVRISGFEEINKNLAIASVMAGGSQRTSEDFLGDILEVLRQAQNSQTTLQGIITAGVRAALISPAANAVRNEVDRASIGAGRLVGGGVGASAVSGAIRAAREIFDQLGGND